MTTGENILERRCEGRDMSSRSDRLMTTSGDTSDRRCAGHNMSPSSDRRMTTSEDTSDRRCEGHNISPSSDRPMTTGEDTLEKVWGPWKEPSSEHPKADVMARYEWTGVWIANGVAMMSMETNAGLTFIISAPRLKINELDNICLG